LQAGLSARNRADRDGPERTCVVTGNKSAPAEMIHFCLSPDGLVVPDLRRRLPGRGVWVSARRSVVDEAARRQVFSRGFKTKAEASPDLGAEVERLLEEEALQFLSIVNKAGLVVAGAAKTESAIAAGGVSALIHASDASNHGVVKLERALRASLGEASASIPKINIFTSLQLDLALGRSNVIHAALGQGEASATFLKRTRRLSDYRAED
jgi:uncharacterized protein